MIYAEEMTVNLEKKRVDTYLKRQKKSGNKK